MHDLFLFEQTGVDADGHATGGFVSTGIRPQITNRLEYFGLKPNYEWFERRRLY
jgi:pilus assembly protein CpaF